MSGAPAEEGAAEESPSIVRLDELYSGWTRLRRAVLRYPDGHSVSREIEDHGAGVAVLAYDPDRATAILVKQVRASVLLSGAPAETLEAIAGILEGDAPEDCARREAMEEAGLRLGALDKVATVWTIPGVSTERLHLYLAAYSEADRVGPGGGLDAEHERITVVELPLTEVAAALPVGGVADAKSMLLLQTLMLRRPELFEAPADGNRR